MRASSGVGSLPRPADPLAMDPADPAYRVRVRDPVANIVRRQTELGLDVVTDGEMNKPRSFITYVTDRLSGFEPSRESGAVLVRFGDVLGRDGLRAGGRRWCGPRARRRRCASTRRSRSTTMCTAASCHTC